MTRLAILLTLLAGPALAQGQACAPREAVIKKLAENFSETLRQMGMQRDGTVLEVYAADDTGTWTILVTRPDGTSCLIHTGDMWEQDASGFNPTGEPT